MSSQAEVVEFGGQWRIVKMSRDELKAIHDWLSATSASKDDDIEQFGVDLWPLYEAIDAALDSEEDSSRPAVSAVTGPNCRCAIIEGHCCRTMSLGPGDIVVVEVPGRISRLECETLKDALVKAFPDNGHLMVSGGAKVRVIRHEDE